MGITATTTPVTELPKKHVSEMLRLMQAYYHNVDPARSMKDLEEKDWVIILWEGGCLRGFSTQMLFDHDIDGHRIQVIFSGDTVIEKSYWHSLALPLAWGRLILSILKGQKSYWPRPGIPTASRSVCLHPHPIRQTFCRYLRICLRTLA